VDLLGFYGVVISEVKEDFLDDSGNWNLMVLVAQTEPAENLLRSNLTMTFLSSYLS
jgi:hypothetical protein